MKRDLFRRYVWLVDIIRHSKKLTYEEISEMWKSSPLNKEGTPLALRTFHNHREAIENLFGIRILCDRSDGNRYYVADEEGMSSTKLKVWMLQTLTLSHLINPKTRDNKMEKRVILDINPEEKFDLITVIEAMKKNLQLQLTYSVPTSDNRNEFTIGAYCVRFWNHSWYVLGKCVDTGKMLVFDIDRIIDIKILDVPFEYSEGFSPAEFFKNYYGMEIDPDQNPVAIRIKVLGKTRDNILAIPLHESQKEVMANSDCSVFEYYFVPTPDFKQTVLSLGKDVEVISPLSLRREIKEQISQMAENYVSEFPDSVEE